MAGGDVVLAMAWSGDVLTLLVPDQKPDQDFQWPLPTEGGMLWTDHMAIPKGRRTRRRPNDASTATTSRERGDRSRRSSITCAPWPARGRDADIDPELANNPLIFPTEECVARLHPFRATTADEETAWSEAYSTVIGL